MAARLFGRADGGCASCSSGPASDLKTERGGEELEKTRRPHVEWREAA